MTEYSNSRALSDFIHSHELMNSYSVIQFMAVVTIRTANNKFTNQQMKVMADLDGYDNLGTLTLLENELDPYLYPTNFDAKWQTFQHFDGDYLLITGNHNKNAAIGKYEVKIIPLQRTRD
jgi:hypothetical protein